MSEFNENNSICPNCGAEVAPGQAFCSKCGTPQNAKKTCSNCGAELAPGQMFCTNCGQKADAAANTTSSAPINQYNQQISKQNNSKKALIAVAAAALVIIVGLILYIKGPSVKEIVLAKEIIEIKTGDSQSVSYTISPSKAADKKVNWSSSNEDVAKVDSNGKITGKGDGSCTITVTAGGKSDTLTVTVKSGPDFKALYSEYCQSKWANVGSDGSYLSIDTNPDNKDDKGIAYWEAYEAVKNINEALKLPDSLLNDMGKTTGAMGKQTEDYDNIGITVSWTYHPDKGLEVTYKLK